MTTHHTLDARLAAALRVVASHGIAARPATRPRARTRR